MLTKSQAKWFFLSATGGFSLVFLWLTVDTIHQVPARSHADQITPEVIRGKEIFDANNCMGCHTILGEGAYYAPELTRVVERRGKPWLEIFLKDPAAMFPGERKMVQYDFTPEEIQDVIAFFTWVGTIDTNGFPRAPDLKQATMVAIPTPSGGGTETATEEAAEADPHAAAPQIFREVCVACHSVGGKGGAVGPALDGVAERYEHDRARLDAWLKNPQAIKPGTAMPNLNLADDVRTESVDWLLTL